MESLLFVSSPAKNMLKCAAGDNLENDESTVLEPYKYGIRTEQVWYSSRTGVVRGTFFVSL